MQRDIGGIPNSGHVAVLPACDPPYLLWVISSSGYISDVFLSLVICGRLLARKYESSDFELTKRHESNLFLALSGLILAASTFFQFAPLPLEYYPSFPFYRPAEMLAVSRRERAWPKRPTPRTYWNTYRAKVLGFTAAREISRSR